MLSYRHAFHAGNFADIHKHVALIAALGRLLEKSAPLHFIDTHAGRGLYDLSSSEALKTGEAQAGIDRLQNSPDNKAGDESLLALYLRLIEGVRKQYGVRSYPGSPLIASTMLREIDRMSLCELHPSDAAPLKALFKGDGRVGIHMRDGFEGLSAFSPPKERRGFVLIDPPYEVKDDYVRVADAIAKSRRKWRDGAYAIWYPLLPEGRHEILLERLAALGDAAAFRSELIRPMDAGSRGMYGSGMAFINPPYTVRENLESTVELIRAMLYGDEGRAVIAALD